MSQSYDANSADSLIPLLRVMNRELHERTEAIQALSSEIQLLPLLANTSDRELRIQEGYLIAAIASHRHEIRVIRREFRRLGCAIDKTDPGTVHIPGENGDYEGGFTWHMGDARVRTMLQD